MFTFLDLFAGIGGIRRGLQRAGGYCVGYVEWDKAARKSYEAIHDTTEEWTHDDISTVDYRDIPRADVWTFGFPCVDISIAGKQKGFEGARSSLFFAVLSAFAKSRSGVPRNFLPTYSLRTLRIFYQSMEGGTSSLPKLNWTTSGTTVNGNYSIREVPECHTTGTGSSLSEYLEDVQEEGYFLSDSLLSQLRPRDQRGSESST